jgi:hypothetical protein
LNQLSFRPGSDFLACSRIASDAVFSAATILEASKLDPLAFGGVPSCVQKRIDDLFGLLFATPVFSAT